MLLELFPTEVVMELRSEPSRLVGTAASLTLKVLLDGVLGFLI